MMELMDKHAQQVKFVAVFVKPKGVAPKWEESDLYHKCRANAGITTVVDELGNEANRFGALTSGQTYVYGPDHTLRFSGGITPARGMSEIGPERKMIEQAFMLSTQVPGKTPVYGCSLL